MKTKYYTLVIIMLFVGKISFASNHEYSDSDKINQLLNEMASEIHLVKNKFQQQKVLIYTQINQVNNQLKNARSLEEKMNLLLLNNNLQKQLVNLKKSERVNIQKIRYLKGLSIIKLLYEKVLGLDHHFSSLVTFNEVNKMANPNNYPEFERIKDIIKQKTDKKKRFQLANLLGKNIYTSTIDMFINLFNADISPKEKETELQNIECILDFTLRMNNDLKTIYFETTFLQKSNEKVMQDIEQLFVAYTKPIGYHTSLKQCRANDDWDIVRDKLNGFLDKMDTLSKNNTRKLRYERMIIDLNFPIDKLLQFINEYNTFIDQGVKYYEKFKIILHSYENERRCSNNLPTSYIKLKSDINIAIDKFNTAYRPVEINGSKMKEILYGINEYE